MKWLDIKNKFMYFEIYCFQYGKPLHWRTERPTWKKEIKSGFRPKLDKG